ncbi:MAG TPA: alpha-ketoglutarate-dependent dioxygenase AlkB [Devosiaceae bacterium]|nr:alpha-ketoglutarate-dependent dioxygenase AlkB [Devosiaceae bacterium]
MRLLRGRLDADAQRTLVGEIVARLGDAPFFVPRMPRTGRPFSVRMSNCGPLGWVSDRTGGYRYQPLHPVTGRPWPPVPRALLELWDDVTGYPKPPQACLVNLYTGGAKMGLHQDRDEADLDAPVLSVSLGDRARFRLGGVARGGATRALVLESGDVLTLEGGTRLAHHGVDRVWPRTSGLLAAYPEVFPEGGRLNLTLRRVTI